MTDEQRRTGGSLIEVSDLTHHYRSTVAVDGLSFEVAAGEVFGLLGHNGAGKSTTIKTLLGLLHPRAGTTTVLGLPSWSKGVEIRRRVGYVPENPKAYDWMTVREALWFVSQFHPTWDADLEKSLADRLELPLEKKLGELSRGTLTKVALVGATAFRPDALILDDPTSGLDAVVRREIVSEVIDLAAEQGRAVLFSSHVLDEVERLCDRIAVVVNGKKVLDRRVDELKSSCRRVSATWEGDAPPSPTSGCLSWQCEGRMATAVFDDWSEARGAELREAGATSLQVSELTLEDIFVEVVHAAKARARAGVSA